MSEHAMKLGVCMIKSLYQALPENITSLLLSVLLQLHSMSNNANGNKRVIFSSGKAWYKVCIRMGG